MHHPGWPVPSRTPPPAERSAARPCSAGWRRCPDEVSLVLLAAPPGYGRTTVVRQWVDSGGHVSGWLQTSPVHVDESRLARDIALSLRRGGPYDRALEEVADEADQVPTEDVVLRLAAAIHDLDTHALLVLDDLHLLRPQASLDLVVRLAERLPAGSRIVATAAQRPRWHVGRLLAQARYVELGVADLSLSRAEAAALLRSAGLQLPADAVDELVRRTEGWPLGLQLAARALMEAADPIAAIGTVEGSSEYFADFFRDEVLRDVSVETIRFLMYSAVLDPTSGSLCDAALETTGSAARLAQARRSACSSTRRTTAVSGSDITACSGRCSSPSCSAGNRACVHGSCARPRTGTRIRAARWRRSSTRSPGVMPAPPPG